MENLESYIYNLKSIRKQYTPGSSGNLSWKEWVKYVKEEKFHTWKYKNIIFYNVVKVRIMLDHGPKEF